MPDTTDAVSTVDGNTEAVVPDLASSLADQLVPLALNSLLAEATSNPLLRHQLDLLLSFAQRSNPPQKLMSNHEEELNVGPLGRAVVTRLTVTTTTTTSTPSCSTSSGFNQC
jgi:hypothetical protein